MILGATKNYGESGKRPKSWVRSPLPKVLNLALCRVTFLNMSSKARRDLRAVNLRRQQLISMKDAVTSLIDSPEQVTSGQL